MHQAIEMSGRVVIDRLGAPRHLMSNAPLHVLLHVMGAQQIGQLGYRFGGQNIPTPLIDGQIVAPTR